jgi:capsid protein
MENPEGVSGALPAMPVVREQVVGDLTMGALFGGFSGFHAANSSGARGEVWWPDMDTRTEMDSWSRYETQRKIRSLYANTGVFRSFVGNGADFIGWEQPQADTGDAEWNKEAEAYFADYAGTREVFDFCGKFNHATAQGMISRACLKDGEHITVLTETKGGAAQFAFYETQDLQNPKSAGPGWKDGVFFSRGRKLAYGLRDARTGKVEVVDARNVIFAGEFDSCGHERPVPPLAHGVNHGLDLMEVNGFTKQGIKASSLVGMVRENKGGVVPRSRQGLAGTPGTQAIEGEGTIEISKVWAGAQIPRMPSGEELKVLTDGRPHPNQRDFKDDLIREIAMGFRIPVEVVWKIAELTGPGVRFVLDHAANWMELRRMNILRPWNRVVWVYTIAKAIKAGRLRRPNDPRWWAVDWVARRSLTIDRGREARIWQEAVERGHVSHARYMQEFYGADGRGEITKVVEEARWKLDECERVKVPFEVAFRTPQGAVAPGQAVNNQTEEEDK